MATSPIYGWAEPDNTDLVKNGALAIRTLGNAIDTTMGTMTPKSTVTAKGSLVAATAASTPANLSVGANGTTLAADSSQSTGLAWVATPSASNPVINSAMNVWQRGTSVAVAASTTTPAYTADRWSVTTAANQAITVSRQATGDTTNLPFVQYCARFQRNSGQTGTSPLPFAQSMETINTIPFAGKTVTVSFYARAGANFSATSNALNMAFVTGTGTDQNLLSSYTGNTTAFSVVATLTSTWQRFTVTGAIGSTVTEMGPDFYYFPTGTASTNDYYEVTGVQIDIGSVALPFRTAGVSYQQELALCQRYYVRYSNSTSNAIHGVGTAYSTTGAYWSNQLPVEMRSLPSSTLDFSTLKLTDGVSAVAITSATVTIPDNKTPLVSFNVTAGLTLYRPYFVQQDSTSGYFGFTAEL